MKKRVRVCIVLLIAVLLLNSAAAIAENSGKFGQLSWKLDNQGTLTVSGRGKMNGYSQPWDDLKSSIKQVVIKDGVLSIGSNNFSGCSNLQRVTMADSVVTIDAFAFDECKNLKEVVFGKGLVSIGMYAFASCGLRSIRLPDSVIMIDGNAFERCASLNDVVLPKKLSMVSKNLFEYCSSLTSIEIPDGVTVVDDNAFYDCGQLRSITIPASVTYVGPYTFMSCDKLKDIYFKGTESQWKSLLATTDFIPSGNRNINVHYGSGGFSFSGGSKASSGSGSSSKSSTSSSADASSGSGSDSSLDSLLDLINSYSHISVSSTVSFSEGKTTVTWTDSENHGPYKVGYKCVDGSAVQTSYWAGGDEKKSTTYSKSFTIDCLIPGHSYEINVSDSKNHTGKGTVKVPSAKPFRDGPFKASALNVSITPLYITESGSKKTTSVFIVDQMTSYLKQRSGGCALHFEMEYPGTDTTKKFFVQLAVIAPNGYAEVIAMEERTFSRTRYGGTYSWDKIGTGYFKNLYDKNGSIPVGEYRLELYMNGMLVNTSTFKVKR